MMQGHGKRGERKTWLCCVLCLALACAIFAAYAEEIVPKQAPALDYFVDFLFLKKVNRNIVAWLRSPDGEIDGPVLQADDNVFYTKRSYKDRISSEGEIFLDCTSDKKFNEDVCYLYGNATSEGPLYALKRAMREGTLYEHPGLILMTPDGNYTAEFFAGYPTDGKDETSWRIDAGSAQSFEESMMKIRDYAEAVVLEERVPEYGDKLLVLCTFNTNRPPQRWILFARLTPCEPTPDTAKDLNKLELDSRESLSGYVDIEGVGRMMYYAQDDPLWATMCYEKYGSKKCRAFSDGGCGPTAAAIVLANLLTPEELAVLGYYAADEAGFQFCTCSVNGYRCERNHVHYHVQTPEEFLRYLPIILANYVAGNNEWNQFYRTENQGTNIDFLRDMAEIFKLEYTLVRNVPDAIEMVKEGKGKRMAVCTAINGSPFTSNGHFLALVYADDNYAYYFDPLRGNKYDRYPKSRMLEIVAPGVVRVKIKDAPNMDVVSYLVLEKSTEAER